MKATFVKAGSNFLPAIKSSYSGNVKVLQGDVLATAKTARKYAQIEINRLNQLNQGF
jgi:lipopolysaccharide export system protein LptA